MSWHAIQFTPEQIEFGFIEIITSELAEIWLSRGGPTDFSVWLKADEEVTQIFLSAVAAETAQPLLFRFGGKPCPEPELENLKFLIGNAYRDI